jgi:hypothetical protein
MSRTIKVALAGVAAMLALSAVAIAAVPGADVRLSRDDPADPGGGYRSDYTLVTGQPYTDATLDECTRSRGRQNEPSVAIDPRQTQVMVGSSNDYCGVHNRTVDGVPQPIGPIWLGYYRSENGGASFQSSLVPGYPDDRSPYAARAQIRTATSGDPVLAWDNHGRLFAGAEASEDPAGTKKGFGDVWVATYGNPGGSTLNDGKEFLRSVTVARGSSAPGTGGKFNDKTAIEADRTTSACEGNVYFSWSSFNGSGGNTINFSRSTDHGQTFSKGIKLGPVNAETQFPDIAITGNGHVYVTFRRIAGAKRNVTDAVLVAKSTDCGRTFSAPRVVQTFTPYDASDVPDPEEPTRPSSGPEEPMDEEVTGGGAGDCGSLEAHCASNYVFFRRDTQVRSTADQTDASSENVFIVYDPTIPGTEVPSGTTYGSVGTGTGSQSGVFFIRYDGASGARTGPNQIDRQTRGHQLFPDITADHGTLHALWWDSRNDPAYAPQRPIGNFAGGAQSAAPLDVYANTSTNRGSSWAAASTRLTDRGTNPNWEQFGGRTVPFAGDYLWIDAQNGQTFGVWTDWRDTVAGTDQREPASDVTGADVIQCRAALPDGTWGPDTCPRAGGLDQNIYGDHTP